MAKQTASAINGMVTTLIRMKDKSWLANKLGMSRPTLYSKLNARNAWTDYEKTTITRLHGTAVTMNRKLKECEARMIAMLEVWDSF